MNGTDSFFVSEGLEDLFDQKVKASASVNGVECDFVSFDSKNRTTQFSISSGNPFELLEGRKLDICISFGSGSERKVNYTNWSYKIEQSSFGFIITVGDCDE